MIAKHIRLFSTDLDGTLLGRPEALWRFTETWQSIPRQLRPLLVYNTGRTVRDTRTLVCARHLPEPDYIIGSIGTELHSTLYSFAEEFGQRFGAAWNLDCVEKIVAAGPGVRRQASEFLHPFKSSWVWVRARRDDLEQLKRQLDAAGIQVHVDYSCRYFLDIMPACAGKGNALAWLCGRLSVAMDQVLVAGDTGNDTSMFLLPGVRGILVGNALPELHAEVVQRPIFVAQQGTADGVLEGLGHFGVIAKSLTTNERTFALSP